MKSKESKASKTNQKMTLVLNESFEEVLKNGNGDKSLFSKKNPYSPYPCDILQKVEYGTPRNKNIVNDESIDDDCEYSEISELEIKEESDFTSPSTSPPSNFENKKTYKNKFSRRKRNTSTHKVRTNSQNSNDDEWAYPKYIKGFRFTTAWRKKLVFSSYPKKSKKYYKIRYITPSQHNEKKWKEKGITLRTDKFFLYRGKNCEFPVQWVDDVKGFLKYKKILDEQFKHQ